MRKILAVVAFILLIATGWLGWQRLQLQQDRQRLGALQTILQAEAGEIGRFERDMLIQAGMLGNIETDLGGLNQEIEGFEAANPDGIPSNLYKDYESQVNRYNQLVTAYNDALARYNQIFADYKSRVERYNLLAAEANGIAVKIGSNWAVGEWAGSLGE
jgi:hypothetical protein